MKFIKGETGLFIATVALLFSSCVSKNKLPVTSYFDYDFDLPLEDTVRLVDETTHHKLYSIEEAYPAGIEWFKKHF